MKLLTERHADKIKGMLSCYDRVILQGTLHPFCYAEGITGFLNARKVRIFDYPSFAKTLRDEIIQNAQRIAQEEGLDIEYIQKKNFRKEDRIQKILKTRGNHPGLVHIFSALESCGGYKPWHDKKTGRTYLKYDSGKGLHYYFYLIHETLGLMYVRVPTWCPFRLQVYFNGHNVLASQLKRKGIAFKLVDNAFVQIEDFKYAQALCDVFPIEELHTILDTLSDRYCPIIREFSLRYHFSLMQVEYSTDIVFHKKEDLQTLYDTLIRTAIHTVKPEHMATFLSKKFHANFQGEVGSDLNTRIFGTRIKHTMGPASIKMYDKFGFVLRLETTTNDVSFFEHYRKVEHKDGTSDSRVAHVKKSMYSLLPLRSILSVSNQRYLEFISTIEDKEVGLKNLQKVSTPVKENDRTYPGFNFFHETDAKLLLTLVRGEFNLRGFQNKDVRFHLLEASTYRVGRLLKRLRTHGLIRKIARSYRYHLTHLGRHVIATAFKLKELVILPELAFQR